MSQPSAGARVTTPGIDVHLSDQARADLKQARATICTNCIHFQTCKYAPALIEFAKTQAPKDEKGEPDFSKADFQPLRWAEICKAYVPTYAVKIDPNAAISPESVGMPR